VYFSTHSPLYSVQRSLDAEMPYVLATPAERSARLHECNTPQESSLTSRDTLPLLVGESLRRALIGAAIKNASAVPPDALCCSPCARCDTQAVRNRSRFHLSLSAS